MVKGAEKEVRLLAGQTTFAHFFLPGYGGGKQRRNGSGKPP